MSIDSIDLEPVFDREITLIETVSSFNDETLRNDRYRINPPYNFYQDFLIDIKNGILNEIVNKAISEQYSKLRIVVDINSHRINENGSPESNSFFASSSYHFISNGNLVENFIEDIISDIENKPRESSNWINTSVEFFSIQLVKARIPVALRYRDYIQLPKGFPGKQCLSNLNTGYNCVETAIVSHFYLHTIDERAKPETKANPLNVPGGLRNM